MSTKLYIEKLMFELQCALVEKKEDWRDAPVVRQGGRFASRSGGSDPKDSNSKSETGGKQSQEEGLKAVEKAADSAKKNLEDLAKKIGSASQEKFDAMKGYVNSKDMQKARQDVIDKISKKGAESAKIIQDGANKMLDKAKRAKTSKELGVEMLSVAADIDKLMTEGKNKNKKMIEKDFEKLQALQPKLDEARDREKEEESKSSSGKGMNLLKYVAELTAAGLVFGPFGMMATMGATGVSNSFADAKKKGKVKGANDFSEGYSTTASSQIATAVLAVGAMGILTELALASKGESLGSPWDGGALVDMYRQAQENKGIQVPVEYLGTPADVVDNTVG